MEGPCADGGELRRELGTRMNVFRNRSVGRQPWVLDCWRRCRRSLRSRDGARTSCPPGRGRCRRLVCVHNICVNIEEGNVDRSQCLLHYVAQKNHAAPTVSCSCPESAAEARKTLPHTTTDTQLKRRDPLDEKNAPSEAIAVTYLLRSRVISAPKKVLGQLLSLAISARQLRSPSISSIVGNTDVGEDGGFRGLSCCLPTVSQIWQSRPLPDIVMANFMR